MNLPTPLAQYGSLFTDSGARWNVDPVLLAAICWAESEAGELLEPKGPGGKGDNGHGHGLMQIDDRTWGDWLAGHDWTNPAVNIDKGTEIFAANFAFFKGTPWRTAASVCAYNAGSTRAQRELDTCQASCTADQAVAALDGVTAPPHRYVSYVLAHRLKFLTV